MKPYTGKVIIATFFYKHQAYLEYCNAIVASTIALERLGIKFDYRLVSGNFHMELCINELLTNFMEEEDATDILMIDSDESWNPEHLIRLLFHEEDIVCGVYRKCCIDKIDFPVILCTADDGSHLGKMLPDGNCLLEAKRVPAGFLKISKRALKRWVEAFPDRWIWYGEKRVYAFFGNEIRDHSFNGMDFCFTDSMREAGLHVWVDPICEITHWGIYPFKGTLDAKLRALKANQEAGNAFSIVEQMAKDIEDGKCS